MCYPVIKTEWDHIDVLAREQNVEELEWLIRLLTMTDPYSVEAISPIAQNFHFPQDDYPRMVTFLTSLCGCKNENDISDDDEWTDDTHGITEADFIYLDDADRGLALGLEPGLYNILLPYPQ